MARTSAMPAAASSSTVDQLPHELWLLILDNLRPVDLIQVACVSRDLKRAAYEEELWINHIDRAKAAVCEGFLGSNATDEDRNRVGVTAAAFAFYSDGDANPTTARIGFFFVMPHLAEAAVRVLSEKAPPGCCWLSIAQRAYDTSHYVEDHPGGAEIMRQRHGSDATTYFDAFPHSPHAHRLMKERMLIFDAVSYVGRVGAPHFARDAVVTYTWSAKNEAAKFLEAAKEKLMIPEIESGLRRLADRRRRLRVSKEAVVMAFGFGALAWSAMQQKITEEVM